MADKEWTLEGVQKDIRTLLIKATLLAFFDSIITIEGQEVKANEALQTIRGLAKMAGVSTGPVTEEEIQHFQTDENWRKCLESLVGEVHYERSARASIDFLKEKDRL